MYEMAAAKAYNAYTMVQLVTPDTRPNTASIYNQDIDYD